jgi:hypothetical protein
VSSLRRLWWAKAWLSQSQNVKPLEGGNLRLPSGFGSLVSRNICRGLSARCVIETQEADSLMGEGEVNIAFPTPLAVLVRCTIRASHLRRSSTKWLRNG